MYPDLVCVIYSNLSFRENIIHSHVKIFHIDISLEGFARILHLSCKGADIFNHDFDDFEFLSGKSALISSRLLHDDDNLGLVKNEEVKYYILTAQVLAKIVFFNLLPKSDEYSHVWIVHHFSSITF